MQTIDLETYEDLENYFADYPNSLAVFDFYDSSNGLSQMQSKRLQSKIDCVAQIDLIRVDVITSPELAAYFQIEITPTLITFLDTELFERMDGNVDDDKIEYSIQALISHAHEIED